MAPCVDSLLDPTWVDWVKVAVINDVAEVVTFTNGDVWFAITGVLVSTVDGKVDPDAVGTVWCLEVYVSWEYVRDVVCKVLAVVSGLLVVVCTVIGEELLAVL
eukprot:m.1051265 g.1051265  ORF g.1051265 m.1051265 type:complete len:103 (-) comp24177_c0_seq1:101-409(-)